MKRSTILTAALLATAFSASIRGESRQSLQYRVNESARGPVQGGSYFYVEGTTARPQDVTLPPLQSEQPFFAWWKSPVMPKGGAWIMLDRRRGAIYELLYIDSDGDGALDDETAVKTSSANGNMAYFGPVKIEYPGENGPTPYHLGVRFYRGGRSGQLYIYPACWMEGTIQLGGQERLCMLIDQNANGTFNDSGAMSGDSDRIGIGRGSDTIRYVGRYIDVDGSLYTQEVARDGTYVTLAPAKEVEYGTVQMGEEVAEIAAGGRNGLFVVTPKDGMVNLPAGDYHLVRWEVHRKDAVGSEWQLIAHGREQQFSVRPRQTVRVGFGEPIKAELTVRNRGRDYQFNQRMQGRLGENIQLLRQRLRPRAPVLKIVDKQGRYDRSYTLEYG